MKKIAAVLALAALVGMTGPLAMAAGTSQDKSQEALVHVLSVDVEGSMLTFKNKVGEQKTAAVLKEAQADLKNVKAGEAVIITWRVNANGEQVGISAIKSADKQGA